MKPFSLILAAAFLILGCEKEGDDPAPYSGPNVEIQFVLTQGDSPIQFFTPVEIDSVHDLQVEVFKFYLSHLELRSSSDTVELAAYELVDMAAAEGKQFAFTVPAGTYTSLYMALGLDSATNATDPVSVEPASPLSAAQGMYWGWASMYRFAMFEGRANLQGALGSGGDDLLSYHPGANSLYRQLEFAGFSRVIRTTSKTTLVFHVDVDQLFNGPFGSFDFNMENQSHTTPSDYYIAERFMNNFMGAISLQ